MIVLGVNKIGAIDDDLGFLEEESGSISDSSVELMMFELVEEEGLRLLRKRGFFLVIFISMRELMQRRCFSWIEKRLIWSACISAMKFTLTRKAMHIVFHM
ncbi:hypothetical protein MKW98_004937, partial [Papaver atlanticum]